MNTLFNPSVRAPRRGFSILELLVSISILLVVMAVMLQVTGGVGDIWKSSTGKISAFQNARSAFATLSRSLSQATLNTYNDYVDAAGDPRTQSNLQSFAPVRFERASELHMLSGPTEEVIPGASANLTPGHAILFQAPLGSTDQSSSAGADSLVALNRTINSIGFYIQYAPTDLTLFPPWMRPLFGEAYRFRLVQVVEPTEKLAVYDSTAKSTYDVSWAENFRVPPSGTQPRARVLAEDVCLLILRPRLSPKDEEVVGQQLGIPFTSASSGSILSPDYRYDSRAWVRGYPTARINLPVRRSLMRSQIPPIIDVAMVAVDRRSMVRFDSAGATPPSIFRADPPLFTDSSKLDSDLATYSAKLSQAGIRHRVFRTAVDLQGAKWSSTTQ